MLPSVTRGPSIFSLACYVLSTCSRFSFFYLKRLRLLESILTWRSALSAEQSKRKGEPVPRVIDTHAQPLSPSGTHVHPSPLDRCRVYLCYFPNHCAMTMLKLTNSLTVTRLVSLGRLAVKDLTFSDGTFIRKGMSVGAPSGSMNLDDEYYECV